MSTINIDRAMIERALEAMMNLPVLGWLPEQEKISFEVITILRTALEQPEQEPWVGLTEDQFLEASRLAEEGNYMVAFQRIQQWLKEKNT